MSAAGRVHEAHGHLDILVNNAGIGHVGTILNTEIEDLERLFRVTCLGHLA
jgi:NAD(P)-dependent dehydrogenase (short-subunit alcohol dehydrogenase family)